MNAETAAPEPQQDRKEEAILAAAKQLFLEVGYAAASMDVLAMRARASKTTLYSRFSSKEALFAAVVSNECARRGAVFDPSLFSTMTIDEALREIGYRLTALIFSPEALRIEQVLLGESPRFPELARIFHDNGPLVVSEAIAGYFIQASEQGLIAVADPRFAADQFTAALKGRIHRELLFGLRHPPTEDELRLEVDRTVDLFLSGALPR